MAESIPANPGRQSVDNMPTSVGLAATCSISRFGLAADIDRGPAFTAIGADLGVGSVADRRHRSEISGFGMRERTSNTMLDPIPDKDGLKFNDDQRREYLNLTDQVGMKWLEVFEGDTEFYSAAYRDLLTGL